MALTDNLVAFWELGEASGNALDSVGSNALTDNNTVGSATGVGGTGTCRDFNAASNEYFSHADNATLSTGDIDFTLAGWLYINSTGTTRGTLAKWDSAGPDLEFQIYYDLFGSVYFQVRDAANSTSPSVHTTATLSATTWYHVVAWHDSVANQLGITLNAGTADTQSHSGGVRDSTAGFNLGNSDFTAWHGRLQGWGLWKRVLTSGERTTLYNGGAYLPYSSMSGGGAAGTVLPGPRWRNKSIRRM